uniref:Secreted protein n=1 Tax=Lepeophtheirus salmonis TaxID=72036 RepID=A0A0K2TGT2_LEPSM
MLMFFSLIFRLIFLALRNADFASFSIMPRISISELSFPDCSSSIIFSLYDLFFRLSSSFLREYKFCF